MEYCTSSDVEQALDKLPAGLDETYERILTRFPSNPIIVKRARHVLACIAFAQRPLSLEEVVQLLDMNFDSPSDTPVTLNDTIKHVEDLEAFVLKKCPASLLESS